MPRSISGWFVLALVAGFVGWNAYLIFVGRSTIVRRADDVPCRFRILVGDRVVGECEEQLQTATFRIGILATPRVEVWSPDGWLSGVGSIDVIRSTTGGSNHADIKFDFKRMSTVLIDNRGGDEVQIECGQWRFIVPMGATIHTSAAAPAEPLPMRAAGEDLGVLGRSTYLIDTSGKRTYFWSEVRYSMFRGPFGAEALGGGTESLRFEAQTWHDVGRNVSYFLRLPPETLVSQGPIRTVGVLTESIDPEIE